jgi:hypothetical protein
LQRQISSIKELRELSICKVSAIALALVIAFKESDKGRLLIQEVVLMLSVYKVSMLC